MGIKVFPHDCLISSDEYATTVLSIPLLIDFLIVLTPISNLAWADFLEDWRTDQALKSAIIPRKKKSGKEEI